MKFIIGKKIKMTQLWQGDEVVPATVISAGPCFVIQVKRPESDGYSAVQLAYGEKKEKNTKKPQQGHFKKAGLKVSPRYLREFKLNNGKAGKEDLAVGDEISVATYTPGDIVDVIGTAKGKGFQGVVKRHGFSGSKKTHGNKDQERMPGSTGATGPQHVFKGTKKPGRMGGGRVTVKNLEIAEVDKENNLLFIKGAVPGARNSLMLIFGRGELVIDKKGGRADDQEAMEKEAGEKESADTTSVEAGSKDAPEEVGDKNIN